MALKFRASAYIEVTLALTAAPPSRGGAGRGRVGRRSGPGPKASMTSDWIQMTFVVVVVVLLTSSFQGRRLPKGLALVGSFERAPADRVGVLVAVGWLFVCL